MANRVLVTGATGFVGTHLVESLRGTDLDIRGAARNVERAAASVPGISWVHLDLDDAATLRPALRGCSAAVYLVHGMAAGPGYGEREARYARNFAHAAAKEGLERIVYLGGVAPARERSQHLRSRRVTGEILRAGSVPVFELRASMIVGHGSTSWKIVRDLAYRLPAMILPRWLANRSQPIGIDDVVYALVCALSLPLERAGVYDLPGPETLSAKQILLRVARQRGHRPLMLSVPLLTPRLSSYWLKIVSGADYAVARELVEGLSSDLVATEREFWELVPQHTRLSFDEALRRAAAGA